MTNDPSEVLYHYTNFGGLSGILQSEKLWATDIRYLNDSLEMKYGARAIGETLAEIAENLEEPTEEERARCAEFFRGPDHSKPTYLGPKKYALRAAAISLAEIEDETNWPQMPFDFLWGNVYVTCLTSQGDSLGQWRGYANGDGFAIGFRADQLSGLKFEYWDYNEGELPDSKNVKGWLHAPASPPQKISYGDDERDAKSSGFINALLSSTHSNENVVPYFEYVQWIVNACLKYSATMKDASFEPEDETRVIASATGYTHKIKIRSGPSSVGGMVPYIELSFPREAITSIRIGPGGQIPLRKRAIQQLLYSHRLAEVEVLHSKAPFRS